MKMFVTGGAGFIGSNLVDRLLVDGHDVIAYDNLSTGKEYFLEGALKSTKFQLVKGDLLDFKTLSEAIKGSEFVFHLAANADIRSGTKHPRKDLEQNTIATFNVLESMRVASIVNIVFSSTGSIYGEPTIFPTPEDAPFPIQTSLYGASKLACEGLIQAYCEGFGFQGFIFRFVSILGERYTHGHVFDFYQKLCQNPEILSILGNGHQRKSYLYIQDCIDAMVLVIDNKLKNQQADRGCVFIYNLGTDETCEVNDSIRWITEQLGLNPLLSYSGGERGWIGDSPMIFLDCSKICSVGWKPKIGIREGIMRTLKYLQTHPELSRSQK